MPAFLMEKKSDWGGWGIRRRGRGREPMKPAVTRWQEVISFWLSARVMERVS